MFLLVLFACADPPSSGQTPVRPPDDGTPTATSTLPTGPAAPLAVLRELGVRNVVVVEVETFRADHLPFYGSERDTFPLSGARPHLVVTGSLASAPWTTPSTASLLTALDTHEHGLLIVDSEQEFVTASPQVQTWLADHGVAAALVNGNYTLRSTNLVDGWQVALESLDNPANAMSVVALGLDWLDQQTVGEPFVLHLRPFDPHQPWLPMIEDRGRFIPESSLPFAYETTEQEQSEAVRAVLRTDNATRIADMEAALSALYDEELLGVDRAIDQLLAGLAARGLDRDTLVVLTGDHGETLFDRDERFGHGWSLHDEQLRVPLVLFHPALEGASEAYCVGETWDVYPTLLELMGVPALEGVRGRSLLDACQSEIRAMRFVRDDVPELGTLMIQRGDVKLVADCEEQDWYAYDLSADPGETVQLDPHGTTTEALLEPIKAYLAEVQAAVPGVECPGG